MEFFAIQDLVKSKINFSQFDFKDMCEDEKEMLIMNLQSKIIIKKEYFEKIIKKQEYLSDRQIILYIQYLLENEYTITDINKIINNVKTIYKMNEEIMIEEIEKELLDLDINDIQEDEKQELELIQDINKLMNDLSIEDEELLQNQETKIYINKLTDENYQHVVNIFRGSLNLKYDLTNFLKRYTIPMINDKFVSTNLLADLIERFVKDTEISESLKKYSLEQIVLFMTKDE
jgi:hypothetical protein